MQVKTFVYFYICLTVHLANGNISPDIEQQCKDVQDSHMCFFNLLKNNTEINRTTLIIQEEYFWHPVKRKRKDCRALSEKERNDLFSAINALRKDKSKTPNVYDNYAAFHTQRTLKSVHHGPNFFGWHRIYLLRFEELLRKVNPSVTLCFWESPLNYYMKNPLDFVMFTDDFLGNGRGTVTTGPFANWTTMDNRPLRRRLGKHRDGRLLAPFEIKYVLSKNRHSQITHPNADFGSDLEMMHNVVHILVGGQMGDLKTSTQDPFFWFHHAYLDSVWEQFCAKIRQNGIDPKDDYVKVKNKLHHPKRRMDRLFPFRNEDGYSDYFTKYVYEYDEHAKCPYCSYSPYLDCNKKKNVCYALSSRDKTRNITMPFHDFAPTGPGHKISILSGQENAKRLIFLPIKIIFEDALKKNLHMKKIAGCQFEQRSPALCHQTSAIISTVGLSNNVTFKNYIVNDVGIPHWIYAFVGISDINNSSSDTLVSISDKMGRSCKPFLLSEDETQYLPWSGLIAKEHIGMFFKTLENVNDGDFQYDPLSEDSIDPRIKMVFRCT